MLFSIVIVVDPCTAIFTGTPIWIGMNSMRIWGDKPSSEFHNLTSKIGLATFIGPITILLAVGRG